MNNLQKISADLYVSESLFRKEYISCPLSATKGTDTINMYYGKMSECEVRFREGGPFWHICTSPIESDIYFRNEEEHAEALNIMAITVFLSRCRLLAYSVMTNHFHFVLEGTESAVHEFWDIFYDRFAAFLKRTGRLYLAKSCRPQYIPIKDLKQLKDEIAYVIRNHFAAAPDYNIFACLWDSGHLYFNPLLSRMEAGKSAAELTYSERRIFKHERDASVDPRIMVLDGVATPASFVDYKRAESFFENAREFLLWTMKNVESMVEVAKRIGEKPNLTDTELRSVIWQMCKQKYNCAAPGMLTPEHKTGLLHSLKYDYCASNAQIARCTGYRLSEINQIFPLSAPTK